MQLIPALRRAHARRLVRPGKGRAADSGMTAIEFVFLTPILYFLIFVCVQFAMFFFAQHVAQASAEDAARLARAERDVPAHAGNWQSDGVTSGSQYLQSVGGSLVTSPNVTVVDNGDDTITATVTGQAVNIFPGLTLSVKATSTGPVERFIPDGP